MSTPSFSIIIPIYNREALLPDTLHSIANQTFQNWECILVDDHSTDNSAKIAQSFCAKDERFSFFNRPANKPKGANSCRNFGFSKASGEFIQWFDSDDLMEAFNLEQRFSCFRDFPDTDLVISERTTFGDYKSVRKAKSAEKVVLKDPIRDYFLGRGAWLTSILTWKRSAIHHPTLPFNEKIHWGQDRLFVLQQLAWKPIKVKYLEEALISYRIHGESITGRYVDLERRQLLSAIMVNFESFNVLPPSLKKDEECLNYYWKRERFLLKKAIRAKSILAIIFSLWNMLRFSINRKVKPISYKRLLISDNFDN